MIRNLHFFSYRHIFMKKVCGVIMCFALIGLISSCTKSDEESEQTQVEDGPAPDTRGFDSDGASNSLFSVSSTQKVRFSRGNLQYKASTNTWRFAEHQFDCIGQDNVNISSTNNGWIDLFGYGTSRDPYPPYTFEKNDNSYPHMSLQNVNGYDWGINAISNGGNMVSIWRTLSIEEWKYLFKTRTNATNLVSTATIAGKYNGTVILPDNWTTPTGCTFDIPNESKPFINKYTYAQWSKMENAGAVFLPACGNREEKQVSFSDLQQLGTYWTSTAYNKGSVHQAYYFGTNFLGPYFSTSGTNYLYLGKGVRLVKNM